MIRNRHQLEVRKLQLLRMEETLEGTLRDRRLKPPDYYRRPELYHRLIKALEVASEQIREEIAEYETRRKAGRKRKG